jgi:hypothetical protein
LLIESTPLASEPRPSLARGLTIWPVVAVTLGAAAIRFAQLGAQSFWEDETVTGWLLHRGGLGAVLRTIPHTESTPPLYYVLAWLEHRLLGGGAVGLRSLSALAGTLTVPVLYAAGTQLASRRVGIIAALLAALSPDLVWYSQEARSYALLVLLATLSFACCVWAWRRPRRLAFALWAISSALALATHYFAAFLIIPEAAWLLTRAGSRRPAMLASAAIAAAGAALLPLAIAQHASGGANYLADIPLGVRLRQIPAEFAAGPPAPVSNGWYLALVGSLAALAIGLLAYASRGPERRAAYLLASLLAVALSVPLALDASGLRILDERNTMGLLPLVLLIVAAGLGSRRAGRVGVIAALGLAASFGGLLVANARNPLRQREDWHGAAVALGRASRDRALVIAPVTDNPAPVPRIVALEGLYLPSVRVLPRAGAMVGEIDVLDIRAVPYFDDFSRAPLPVAPAPGFRLVRRVARSNFVLFRYVRDAPLRVTPASLGDASLLPRSPDVMIGFQRAGSPGVPRHPI